MDAITVVIQNKQTKKNNSFECMVDDPKDMNEIKSFLEDAYAIDMTQNVIHHVEG